MINNDNNTYSGYDNDDNDNDNDKKISILFIK